MFTYLKHLSIFDIDESNKDMMWALEQGESFLFWQVEGE